MPINFERDLDRDQLAAVMSDGDRILCVANAGSGKTRTMTYRVARLIAEGVAPGSILMLTFTNKAAREMTERIGRILGGNTSGLTSGTFHSVAIRYMRQHPYAAGVDPRFTVLCESDSKDLMNFCRMRAIADYKEERGDVKWDHMPGPGTICGLWGYCRNTGIDLDAHLLDIGLSGLVDDGLVEFVREFVLYTVDLYEREKKRQALCDFDDALAAWDRMLDSEGVRGLIRQEKPYVFVDEYQDINYVQASIIRKLCGPGSKLMAVGDDAQCIYGFRGSDIRYIRSFKSVYQGARVYPIRYNYRSLGGVVDYALEVINRSPDYCESPKEMLSVRDGNVELGMYRFLDDMAQAGAIASMAYRYIRDKGVPPEQIAVLLRNNHISGYIEQAFGWLRIPVSMECGVPFYERPHVRMVVHFLRFLSNPSNQVSFFAMVGTLRGVGQQTVRKFFQLFETEGFGLDAFLGLPFPKRSREAADVMCRSIQKGAALLEQGGPDMVMRLIACFREGYVDDWVRTAFPKDDERAVRRRLADLDTMQEFARGSACLEDFLSDAIGSMESPNTDCTGRVRIMTMHKAKGLEFSRVFLPYVSDGIIPCKRNLEDNGSLEEERRLAYVAVTRARDGLVLSFCEHTASVQGMCMPSRLFPNKGWEDGDALFGTGFGRYGRG